MPWKKFDPEHHMPMTESEDKHLENWLRRQSKKNKQNSVKNKPEDHDIKDQTKSAKEKKDKS